jgi:hypothetical protein
MGVDAVAAWLVDSPDWLVEALYEWAEGVEAGVDGVLLEASFAGFADWWERLSAAVGGTMPPSMQTDVKRMFGDVARCVDRADVYGGDDDIGVVSTRCRESLIFAGLAPGGMWRAELLADRLENSMSMDEHWSGLDVVERSAQLDKALRGLLRGCDELLATTPSIRARGMATAVAAVCSLRVVGADVALMRVRQFFEYERQAVRESGDECTWAELTYVALAGVTAHQLLGDRAGVQEVMRLIRQRAEPAGESLPASFMSIWARGLRDIDPALAQMIARQLLFDVDDGGDGDRTDAAFAAAFLLLETSLAAGDRELADQLANEWTPLALEASYGPGSQSWVDAFEGAVGDEQE